MPLTAAGYSINSLKADTARYSLNAPTLAVADSARIAGTVPNNSITSVKIAPAQVVKSLNGLKDGVTLRAQGGATITSNNDTITINSGPGGGGTGIQGVQNTNNTIDVINPNGPTATVNVKVPLSLTGNVDGKQRTECLQHVNEWTRYLMEAAMQAPTIRAALQARMTEAAGVSRESAMALPECSVSVIPILRTECSVW